MRNYEGEERTRRLKALVQQARQQGGVQAMQKGSAAETGRRGTTAMRKAIGAPTIEEFGGMSGMEKAAAIGNIGLNIAGVLGGVGAAGAGLRLGLRNMANLGIRKGLAATAKGAATVAKRAIPAAAGAFGTSAVVEEALPDSIGPQVRNLIRTGAGVAGGLAANKLVNSVPGLKLNPQDSYEIPEASTRKGPKLLQKVSDKWEEARTPGGPLAVRNRAAYQELLEAQAYERNINADIIRGRDRLDSVVSGIAKASKKKANDWDSDITDYLEGAKRIQDLPAELGNNGDFVAAAQDAMKTIRNYSLQDTDMAGALAQIVREPAFRNGNTAKEALERVRFLYKNQGRLVDAGEGVPWNPKKAPLTVDMAERDALRKLTDMGKYGPEADALLREAMDNPAAAQRGSINITRFIKNWLPREYMAFKEGENFQPDPQKFDNAVKALMSRSTAKGGKLTREQAVATVREMVANSVNVENQSKVKRRVLGDLAEETPALRAVLEPIKDWRVLMESAGKSVSGRLGGKRKVQGLQRAGAIANEKALNESILSGTPSPIKGIRATDAKVFGDARVTNANPNYSENLVRDLGGRTPSLEPDVKGRLYADPALLKYIGSAVRGGIKNPAPGAKGAESIVTQASREWNNTARQALVGMNPKGMLRNSLSDRMMMIGGGMDVRNMRKNMRWAAQAADAMDNGKDLDDIMKVAKASGIATEGFLNKTMPTGFEQAKAQGQNIMTTAAKKWQRGLSKVPLLGKLPARIQKNERIRRLAFFKDQFDKAGIDVSRGFDMNTIAGADNVRKLRGVTQQVNKVLFDYSNPSIITRKLNEFSPISSYTSNAYANTPQLMLENPGRYAAIIEAVAGADRALGDLGYGVDASRLLPMGGLVGAAEDMGRGKPVSDALYSGITEDFGNSSVNMLVRGNDVLRNRNNFGAKIADPKEGKIANALDLLGYFARPYIPGAVQSLDPVGIGGARGRTARLLMGEPDGKKNAVPIRASEYLLGLTGLPVVRDDIMSLQKALTNAKRNGASPREQAVLMELIRLKTQGR